MDGLLIIDKPAGITSHDVVARVRRALRTKRVGHTGTLDPFATGVMVLVVGRATRLARFLDKDTKEYLTTVRFGFATDTGDLTGEPLNETVSSDDEVSLAVRNTDWPAALERFTGEILQVPPMYSAKKVDGVALHSLARRGIEIERKAVNVTIHELDTVSIEPFILRVKCSAGTYIRTLAEDIGRAVGLGAHLTELRRIRSGRFGIDASIGLSALESSEGPSAYLTPLAEAVAHLKRFTLPEYRVSATRSGLSSNVEATSFDDGEFVAIFTEADELIAVGSFSAEENAVQPKVVLG